MSNQPMVLYDSPEAATYQTGLTGWVSRDGRFWDTDEHMARWSGCTHKKCPNCGTINEVSSFCKPCRDKEMNEKFAAFPVEKWDGDTPLCIFDTDKYFFGESVLDWLRDHPEAQDVLICKCKPGYLSLIDQDNWADDLPEDGELPSEVSIALDALNAAIRIAPPSCWWADDIAIDVADLRTRVAAR
jgi:hypothetical protein